GSDRDANRNWIAKGQGHPVGRGINGHSADAMNIKDDVALGDRAKSRSGPNAVHLNAVERAAYGIELYTAPSVSVIVVVVGHERQSVAGRTRIDTKERVEVAAHSINRRRPAGDRRPRPPNVRAAKVTGDDRLTRPEILARADITAGRSHGR